MFSSGELVYSFFQPKMIHGRFRQTLDAFGGDKVLPWRRLDAAGGGGCCHHLLPAAAGGGCLLIAQPCQPTRGGARCCSGSSRAFRYSARERVAQVQGRSCTLQQPPILTSQQSQIAENRRAGEPNLVTLIIQLTCRPARLCCEPASARLLQSAELWLLLQDQ